MKIGTSHLTYCTNIHPGEAWSEVFANLKQYIPVLKAEVSPNQPFGIGLRCSDLAARELSQPNTLAQFRDWLSEQDLYVFTLNGFPYGGFHRQVVKDQVYAPDWSKQERLDYTLRLTSILADLLPSGMDGSISTLPLSYKPWFISIPNRDSFRAAATTIDTIPHLVTPSVLETTENRYNSNQSRQSVIHSASIHLAQVAAQMVRIREKTGKLLHLGLEPEPDGLIENAAEVVDYFQTYLLPIGGDYLASDLGISRSTAESYLLEHIRICYDTCHFALEYEEPGKVFEQFKSAGIQISKIQISAALQVNIPEDVEARRQIAQRLRPFAESTYLHQVIECDRFGNLNHYPDLEIALPNLEHTTSTQWRIHFHVPIFIHDYQLFQSTQDDIVTVFDLLHTNACNHLEIETYTWDVLPEGMKLDLLASLKREYDWVCQTAFATQMPLARI